MRICLNEDKSYKDWNDFFVWIPMIIIDNDTSRRYWVWLETIRRKRIHSLPSGHLIHRIKWPTHGEWNI